MAHLRSDHSGATAALPRLYRRQSELAETSRCSAVAPRRCLGLRMSSRRRSELLQRLTAAVRHGPPCGWRARCSRRRHRRRGARSCARRAQRSVDPAISRSRCSSAIRVSEQRRHKARMEKRLCRRGQRSRAAGRAPAGGRRGSRSRRRASRSNRKGGDAKKLLDACRGTRARTPAISVVQVQICARRQDRGRREDDTVARANLPGLRWGGMVGRAADHVAQASRSGRCRSAYLTVADAAEPTKENSRVERLLWQAGSRCAISMTRRRRGGAFRPHPEVSNHPTSLARSNWLGRVRKLPIGRLSARRVPGGGELFAAITGSWHARVLGLKRLRSHRRRQRRQAR